jgi:hypothetical protein
MKSLSFRCLSFVLFLSLCRSASGGDRREDWPAEVIDFLKSFLPVQSPPNYQLVTDEMERLCNL